MKDSKEISNYIQDLPDEENIRKICGFVIPNCLNLSSLFYFGLSHLFYNVAEKRNQTYLDPAITGGPYLMDNDQLLLNQKNFKRLSYINFSHAISDIKNKIPMKISPNNFYYLYDRNPNIIANLVKICQYIYSEELTDYHSLDDKHDKYIIEKLNSRSLKVNKSVVFYANNLITQIEIPLHSYGRINKEKNKSFIHSLNMAIGFENNICCLRMFMLKKSFYFCSGVISEEKNANLSNFQPFFLFYIPVFLDNQKAPQYQENSHSNNHTPLAPSMFLNDDYPKEFINILYDQKWTKKKYTFQEYLIQCLIYPAAFVAGTTYPLEEFGYYLTVLFSNNNFTKDNIINSSNDPDFISGCKELFTFYQKFLLFLRFLVSLIDSFIEKNCKTFIDNIKKIFTVLPIINPLITSPFIDLIKHLHRNLKPEQGSDLKKFRSDFTRILDCTIDDGKELSEYLNHIFNFNILHSSSTITIYQACKEINQKFKVLIEYFNDKDLKFIRKVKIGDKLENEYKFYNELKDSISSSTLIFNEIEI